jgi:hypothetical protein
VVIGAEGEPDHFLIAAADFFGPLRVRALVLVR